MRYERRTLCPSRAKFPLTRSISLTRGQFGSSAAVHRLLARARRAKLARSGCGRVSDPGATLREMMKPSDNLNGWLKGLGVTMSASPPLVELRDEAVELFDSGAIVDAPRTECASFQERPESTILQYRRRYVSSSQSSGFRSSMSGVRASWTASRSCAISVMISERLYVLPPKV